MSETMHDNQQSSGWTTERVELLKTLQIKGFSCSQIAGEIGGVTRNAVIGKLHRMGIHKDKSKPTRSRAHTNQLAELNFAKRGSGKREGPSSQSRAKREIKAQKLRIQFESVEIVDLSPDQLAVAVPFSGLTAHTCKWPIVGDARDLNAMRFCGAEPRLGRPFCVRHSKIAFQPLARRSA